MNELEKQINEIKERICLEQQKILLWPRATGNNRDLLETEKTFEFLEEILRSLKYKLAIYLHDFSRVA